MKLFDNIFDKKGINIGAPMAGECISVKEVKDPTFKEEVLGRGVAIIPSSGKVYAPSDGTIEMIFPTGHAISIVTKEGVELLIHIGIDTVELKGRHFKVKVNQGDIVKKGDLLLEANIVEIQKEGYDVATPVVITNSSDFTKIILEEGKVKVGDNIMLIRK